MVVARDHLLGLQIDEGPEQETRRLLDVALVAFGDAVREGGGQAAVQEQVNSPTRRTPEASSARPSSDGSAVMRFEGEAEKPAARRAVGTGGAAVGEAVERREDQ